MPSFDTASGGTITLDISTDPFVGKQLWIEIDQSSNMKNTEDSASIVISSSEVRQLIDLLHDYIKFTEGKDYFKKIEEV